MSTQQILKLGGCGILNHKDVAEFKAAVRRVYALMCDGRWYAADEIENAAGEHGRPAREGLRRMRELREAGFEIDRERQGDGRTWKYRLRIKISAGIPAHWRTE
jgi:hypothetical protein